MAVQISMRIINKNEWHTLCHKSLCFLLKMMALTQIKTTAADTGLVAATFFLHQSLLVSLQILLHVTVTALVSQDTHTLSEMHYKLSCREVLPAESVRLYLANSDTHLFNLTSLFNKRVRNHLCLHRAHTTSPSPPRTNKHLSQIP